MPDEGILTREDNEAAAAFVRDKARTNIRIFGDMLPETRAHAFAVAGIEEMRRLKQVQEAIARVPEGGDWKDAREEIAAALGDPEKNAARAETVLRTNCFQAYAAARYRSQMEDKEVFPYLKYVTVGDSRVRDSHARLNGTILRKDDPFWETHYPPWDWGCRCVAVELTEEMAREEQADGTGSVRDEGWSQDYRAAHRGRDESKDYKFRPGSLSIALDDAALKPDGTLRYDEGTLQRFNEKMEKATVELPDGTTKNVREWMWEPVRERAEKKLLALGRDGKEHSLLLDRNTGRILDEAAGTKGRVEPNWDAFDDFELCAYHNHTAILPDLSPHDVEKALRGNVHEVGAIADGGATMRLEFLGKDRKEVPERLLKTVLDFKRRMEDAKSTEEKLRIATELDKWLRARGANGGTGLFKITEKMP